MRLEAARIRTATAQSQLNAAKAVLESLQEAHGALERELTPKPRKKAEPKPAAPKAAEQSDPKPAKVVNCDVCYELEENPIHDASLGYSGYHKFDPGKAGKKRKTKAEPQIAIVKDEDTSALAVGAD